MCNCAAWPSELLVEFKMAIERFNIEYGQHVLLAGDEQCGKNSPGHPMRWSQVEKFMNDPLLFDVYDAVAQHYPNWTSTQAAKDILHKHGKPLWDTEDQGAYQYDTECNPYRLKRIGNAHCIFASRVDVRPHEYRNDFSGKVGMKLRMSKDVTVKELGRWYMQDNKKTHELSIYDADTLELLCEPVVVDMNKGAEKMDCHKGFVYAKFKTPVKLQANRIYYIVSNETKNGDTWYGKSMLPQIAADLGVGEVLCGVILNENEDKQYFYGSSGNCYGPVNFRY